jgi:hypothetical protein
VEEKKMENKNKLIESFKVQIEKNSRESRRCYIDLLKQGISYYDNCKLVEKRNAPYYEIGINKSLLPCPKGGPYFTTIAKITIATHDMPFVKQGLKIETFGENKIEINTENLNEAIKFLDDIIGMRDLEGSYNYLMPIKKDLVKEIERSKTKKGLTWGEYTGN